MKNKYISYIVGVFVVLGMISCTEETLDDSETGTLTGKVVMEGSNEPVPNARISTNPSTSTVFSDAQGAFIIPDIAVDDYSVQARKDSLVTAFEGATITANSTTNIVFEMQPESVLNEAPIAPVPLSPADNATNQGITTEFVWMSSDTDDDEINYTLELRNEITDETRLFENITDTTLTVQGLSFNRKYFWQVTASDGKSDPVLSEIFAFRTQEAPLARKLITRQVDGNSVIFSVDDDGSTFQLTASGTNSFRPRRNTQVNKIAFLRSVGGQVHLFTMGPDGSNVQQVTSNIPVAGFNFEMVDFSWADNGNSLVYPNFSKLYKINATGGGINQLYETPDGSFITECNVAADNSKIAIITNNVNGYDAKIQVISPNGSLQETVLENQPGAVGGLEFSVDGSDLLYTRDVSGFENANYRQLNAHIFVYNFSSDTATDISLSKPAGSNDLDPRFSPNEAQVIFVNTSNDGQSEKRVFTSDLVNSTNSREQLVGNASMPDWE